MYAVTASIPKPFPNLKTSKNTFDKFEEQKHSNKAVYIVETNILHLSPVSNC